MWRMATRLDNAALDVSYMTIKMKKKLIAFCSPKIVILVKLFDSDKKLRLTMSFKKAKKA